MLLYPGILNVRKNHPASNEQQTSGTTNHEPRDKDETQDSRYIDADVNDVDPAIMEKLAVYIARYSYDPVQHSPNENPEMELAFQAGDYLYVFGEMDEVSATTQGNNCGHISQISRLTVFSHVLAILYIKFHCDK